MWNDRYTAGMIGRGVCFDPGTALMAGSLAMSAVGTGIGAMGTIAGGSAARQAGVMQNQADVYQAEQLQMNEPQEIASAQRQMLDTQQRTRMAISTSRASAAGSGVNAGIGSPVTNQGELAARGRYQSMMDLFKGQSEATGTENQRQGVLYSGQAALIGGEEAAQAASYNAAATIAGGGASMLKTYGSYAYPTPSGRAGLTS